MALPEQFRECLAMCGRERPRALPVDLRRPAPNDPEFHAGQLAGSDQPVNFLVDFEALHPVIRPMVGDKPERLFATPHATSDRMEYRRRSAIHDDAVRLGSVEPKVPMMIAEPT